VEKAAIIENLSSIGKRGAMIGGIAGRIRAGKREGIPIVLIKNGESYTTGPSGPR
jgi:soluble P-type ATPase